MISVNWTVVRWLDNHESELTLGPFARLDEAKQMLSAVKASGANESKINLVVKLTIPIWLWSGK